MMISGTMKFLICHDDGSVKNDHPITVSRYFRDLQEVRVLLGEMDFNKGYIADVVEMLEKRMQEED